MDKIVSNTNYLWNNFLMYANFTNYFQEILNNSQGPSMSSQMQSNSILKPQTKKYNDAKNNSITSGGEKKSMSLVKKEKKTWRRRKIRSMQ